MKFIAMRIENQKLTGFLMRAAGLLMLSILILGSSANAQNMSINAITPALPNPGPVTGPGLVTQGTAATYTVTATAVATYAWSLSNSAAGTITVTSLKSVSINWNSSFAGVVTINCVATNVYGSVAAQPLSIQVIGQLIPGTVSPDNVYLNYNGSTTLNATAATGGYNTAYGYQWQYGSDPNNWNNIGGATGLSYNTGNLTGTRYYRLVTTQNGNTVTSNIATVTVYPQLVSGSIGTGNQQLNYGGTAATLSAGGASGGNGGYGYQWQSSPDNSNWYDIGGASGLSYNPGSLTSTTYYRLVTNSNGIVVVSNVVSVTVYPQLVSGSIGPASQGVNYGGLAATLTGSPASGGNGAYGYQWQSSPNNGNWNDISGANGLSYAPGNITATTYYRLETICNGVTVFSNVATYTVYSQLVSGSISPANQSINYNSNSATLTASAASGGNGSFNYQWQSSANNVNWNDIGGATGLSYNPGTLTATTYFRIVSVSNGTSVVSSSVTVSVYPQLFSGSASGGQTINYGATPSGVAASEASGGNGIYGHQWQSSPDNGNWYDIPGATGLSYSPGSLTSTTYYRLVTSSYGVTVISNVVTIGVYPQLASGSIGPASQGINYGGLAATLTAGGASGGNGAYGYQWQSSPDNGNWYDISGANGLSYAPGNLTATTYYRLVTISNGVTVISNVATYTVYPQLVSGGITPANQNINYNGNASTLTASAATGGNGPSNYQWQSSPNNANWGDIGGATGLSYIPGNLTATTYFRLEAVNNGVVVISNSIVVTVYPQLLAGSASGGLTINYGAIPSGVTSGGASGGNGIYSYQWQSSLDNANWNDISGATGLNYTPGSLTTTTYYHLVASSNGVGVPGNTVTVTVYPQLIAGAASGSQSINYGATPSAISSAAATGGNGTYTYQWQSSTGGAYADIAGATGLTCPTSPLTTTTSYHLIAISNGVSTTGNAVTVTIYGPLVAGTVTGNQTISSGATPVAITAAPSTGGSGTYTYQWQSSADGVTFANITGAAGLSYTSGPLTVTTTYHLVTVSNGASVTSNPVTIIVNAIGCQLLASVPSITQNYISTIVPRVEGFTAGQSATTCQAMQTVQYIDGLGRPLQTVQVKGNPTADKDVVQAFTYDAYGREATKYLPYTTPSNDGTYKPDALNAGAGVFNFYNPNGNGVSGQQQPGNGVVVIPNPGAATGFEASPLSRVVEQGAPGNPWQLTGSGVSGAGHTKKIIYRMNTDYVATDTVNSYAAVMYGVAQIAGQAPTLVIATNGVVQHYPVGQLYVTITEDENWTSGHAGTTEEYKDKQGHIILKRVRYYDQSGVLQLQSTYYVYDDLNRLTFVILPANNTDNNADGPTPIGIDGYCYRYWYDQRGRLSGKKLPGKGWEYIVYNKMDQPVLTQDSMQRVNNQWTVTKYDGLGRVIMTGLWNAKSAISQATLQASVYAAAQWDNRDYSGNTTAYPTGYIVNSYPAINTLLTVNYYDGYTGIPGFNAAYTAPTGAATGTTGLLTATKTAVLNNPADMLLAVNYYDSKGREIQTYGQHYNGGVQSVYNYDAVSTSYDFTNQVIAVKRSQYLKTANNTAAILSISSADSSTYDHMGRMIQNWLKLNQEPQVLASQLEYNEIGQLKTKHLHSATGAKPFMQDISYTYNERGWLTQSAAGLFEEQLQYNNVNNVAGISAVPQYNGNIASQSWGTLTAPDTKSYTYTYDKLNRLLSANSTDNNSENGLTYDKRGNILTLNRYQNGTLIDQLAYTYPYNQITSITDGSGNNTGFKNGTFSYTYDGNGNMSTDPSKGTSGISVIYNLLNLPQTISGSANITYVYDANGRKLRRISAAAGTTDYVNGVEYDNGALSFIQTAEGRVIPTPGAPNYEYQLTDHLGNSRVVFDTGTGAARMIQQDDYYAFGMDIPCFVNGASNEYLYNKKELQVELGWYDYGARFYDPVIGRWTSVDPKAELGRRWSPYNYGFDNPIIMDDPDGMWPGPNFLSDAWSSAKSSFKSYYTSAASAIAHPINTAKAIYNSAKQMSAGELITAPIRNSPGVKMITAEVTAVKALVQGDGKAFGGVVGNQVANTTAVLATDGVLSAAGKGLSALTTSTLTNTVKNVAGDLNASGIRPATVGGAELNGQTAIATSGAPPTNVAPQLQQAAQSLGGMGAVTPAGTVGACCEIHAANELLLQNPGAAVRDINLTPAIRPRTGETVPMCDNCKTIFKKN